ncbi:MAG: TetR/AcrR family transcriptional regulator [Dethiobacter sp.]|nr:TetR/AcrR family transcriptional regulator [Dethiobacter sp.]
MSRNEKERSFRRKLLAETAARLFRERSYHTIKVEEITNDAEFSKGSFYKYFYNKDELVCEIVYSETQKLSAQLAVILNKSEPIYDILMFMAQALLTYHCNTIHLTFILDELLPGDNSRHSTPDRQNFVAEKLMQSWKLKIATALEQNYSLLNKIFAAAVSNKQLREIPVPLLSLLLDNLAKGMSYRCQSGSSNNYKDNILPLAETVRLLLEGIKA